ncbi:MAG: hypothetical protein AVDCRST_MAG85-4284, partial [uncultured Solirubrobacteraceae bacterium]
ELHREHARPVATRGSEDRLEAARRAHVAACLLARRRGNRADRRRRPLHDARGARRVVRDDLVDRVGRRRLQVGLGVERVRHDAQPERVRARDQLRVERPARRDPLV